MRRPLLLLALLSTLSCSVLDTVGQGVQSLYPGAGELTQAELRAALFEFSHGFNVIVTEAADRIALQTTESKQRRLSLLWKIRMPAAAQLAAGDVNPRTGYVEALTVAVAQRQYFEDGAGSALFGAQQPIALTAAREIEQNALRLGESFLPPAKLAELHGSIEQLARNHPLRGEFLRESMQAGLAKAETGGVFNEIIGLPMAPFRAIAGVESGAQAIHEFNATAAQFTEIVDQLPQQLRWQMELLSYDLQEPGGVLEHSQRSFDSVAQSAERLSAVAERAPDDMRETIVGISEELELRSKTLSALLAEYRAAIVETGTTAEKTDAVVQALERVSEQVNQAGVAWGGLVAELKAPGPPREPGQAPPRPFDVLEYERTAVAIRETAAEVRGLLADLETAKGALSQTLASVLLRNGVILIAVFFVALLGYRWIASRIAPTR